MTPASSPRFRGLGDHRDWNPESLDTARQIAPEPPEVRFGNVEILYIVVLIIFEGPLDRLERVRTADAPVNGASGHRLPQHRWRPKFIAEFPSGAVFRPVARRITDEKESRNGKDRDQREHLARRSHPGPLR
jgi:hypothetical protein